MAITGSTPAQITARTGLARCATIRCGCAPNDVEDVDSSVEGVGVLGAIVHSEPLSHLSTSEGTNITWGVGGAGGGVDPMAGGDP